MRRVPADWFSTGVEAELVHHRTPRRRRVRYPDYVTSTLAAQPTFFHLPLKLAPGKVVTAVSYFHKSPDSQATSVDLWRFRVGPERENLAGGVTIDGSNTIVEKVLLQSGPIRIRRGYTYFFTVSTSSTSGQVRGIKVTYH